MGRRLVIRATDVWNGRAKQKELRGGVKARPSGYQKGGACGALGLSGGGRMCDWVDTTPVVKWELHVDVDRVRSRWGSSRAAGRACALDHGCWLNWARRLIGEACLYFGPFAHMSDASLVVGFGLGRARIGDVSGPVDAIGVISPLADWQERPSTSPGNRRPPWPHHLILTAEYIPFYFSTRRPMAITRMGRAAC